MHMNSRKWPDRRHWQFAMERLGEDEHGVWAHVPAGTVAQRGDEPPRPLEVGFVGLVPSGRWWVAEVYRDHPRYAVYVNIGTPCEWHGDRVTQIDLDLDVVRYVDGSVEILDEDEFMDHQARFGYPRRLVDGARTAAAVAVEMLVGHVEPFAAAADAWLDLAASGRGQ